MPAARLAAAGLPGMIIRETGKEDAA